MIDDELCAEAFVLLTTAILELSEDAAGACVSLPSGNFQRRTRLASLAAAGRDISVLATAAVVLLRRSRMEFPPA